MNVIEQPGRAFLTVSPEIQEHAQAAQLSSRCRSSGLLASTRSTMGNKLFSLIWDLLGIRAQFRRRTSSHEAALKPVFPHQPCCNRGNSLGNSEAVGVEHSMPRGNRDSALALLGSPKAPIHLYQKETKDTKKDLCYLNVPFSKTISLWAGRMKEESLLCLSVPRQRINLSPPLGYHVQSCLGGVALSCLPSTQSIWAKAPTGDEHLPVDTSEMEHFDPTLAQLRAVMAGVIPGKDGAGEVSCSDQRGNAPLTMGEALQSQDIPVLSLAQETTAVLCCQSPQPHAPRMAMAPSNTPCSFGAARDGSDQDATSSERSQSTPGPPLVSTACLSSWNINPKSTPLAIISSCVFFFPFCKQGCSDICSQHGLHIASEGDYLLPITTLKFKWNDVLIALL